MNMFHKGSLYRGTQRRFPPKYIKTKHFLGYPCRVLHSKRGYENLCICSLSVGELKPF